MRVVGVNVRLAACLLALTVVTACGRAPGTESGSSWADSYAGYRATFRPLDPQAQARCEGQLHRILMGIDDNQACSADSDCTLLSHEPFGPTVPVRKQGAEVLLSDMKQFDASCNGRTSHFVANADLVNAPACVKNRCMVRTSVKD